MAASFLEEEHGYARLSFATPLKRMLSVLVPDGTAKTDCPPGLQGKSYRHALQTLGTDWGRVMIGESIWCDAAMRSADEMLDFGVNVCLDDVRFENEALAIRQRGGLILSIERPQIVQMPHASESGIPPELVSRVIVNDSSPSALYAQILRAVSEG